MNASAAVAGAVRPRSEEEETREGRDAVGMAVVSSCICRTFAAGAAGSAGVAGTASAPGNIGSWRLPDVPMVSSKLWCCCWGLAVQSVLVVEVGLLQDERRGCRGFMCVMGSEPLNPSALSGSSLSAPSPSPHF